MDYETARNFLGKKNHEIYYMKSMKLLAILEVGIMWSKTNNPIFFFLFLSVSEKCISVDVIYDVMRLFMIAIFR